MIKICGVTNCEDALMVSKAGADYLGILINVPQSPRSLSIERAHEVSSSAGIPVITLTFDLAPVQMVEIVERLKPFAIQLAGNETDEEVKELKKTLTCEIWKSLHLPTSNITGSTVNEIVESINNFTKAGVDRVILDTLVAKGIVVEKGGTGQVFDWFFAREIKERVDTFIFLAGGIKPENVRDALIQVEPDGIDLSSGVEKFPGKKDPERVQRVITIVRNIELSL